MQRQLVIFARAPRLGRVKKRLARDLGAVAALRFHRLNTAALLRRIGDDSRWTTTLAVTPDRTRFKRRGLWREATQIAPQGGGDLGARLARAFAGKKPGPVVVVGTDIPGIRRHHVAQAFQELGRYDAVLGPASDGGYWLIGLRRHPRTLRIFEGVRWGGPQARADTLANLRRHRASVAFLEELQDVDTAADLARLREGGGAGS